MYIRLLRRLTQTRLETQGARDRLLASGRTPSKQLSVAKPGSSSTNGLLAAATAGGHPQSLPATPVHDGSDSGGADSHTLVSPLTLAGALPGENSRCSFRGPLGRGDDPGWPVISPIRGQSFTARLSEVGGAAAGFTAAEGATAPGARPAASHAQNGGGSIHSHMSGQAKGQWAAAAASLAEAAARLEAAMASSSTTVTTTSTTTTAAALVGNHSRESSTGSSSLLPPLHAGQAGASSGALSEAEDKARRAAEEEREIQVAKQASSKLLAGILMGNHRRRTVEAHPAAPLPVEANVAVSDAWAPKQGGDSCTDGPCANWGKAGEGKPVNHNASVRLSEGGVPGAAGCGGPQLRSMSFAGWRPPGLARVTSIREGNDDWKIQLTVRDLLDSMLDELAYGF